LITGSSTMISQGSSMVSGVHFFVLGGFGDYLVKRKNIPSGNLT
jgi:hypothetical protein